MKRQQHREERKQRRLAEEATDKKRRRRRKNRDKQSPDSLRPTPHYRPLDQYETDRVDYSTSHSAHYQTFETYSADTGRSTSGSAYDMPKQLHNRRASVSADHMAEPLHSRRAATGANHKPEPLHSGQTVTGADYIPETLHNRQISGKASDRLRRRKKRQIRED